jgi:hypothetical protein
LGQARSTGAHSDNRKSQQSHDVAGARQEQCASRCDADLAVNEPSQTLEGEGAGVHTANPAFKTVRETSSGLNANPKTVISSEIRADCQVVDLMLVDQDAGGDIGGEIAFGVADDDFEEALQGTWSNNPSIAVVTGKSPTSRSSIRPRPSSPRPRRSRSARPCVWSASRARAAAAVTAGGNGLTSTALDFTTLGLAAGRLVKVGDGDNAGHSLATAADNCFCRISAVAAHELSFDVVPAGWAADTGTGVALRAFAGDFLMNSSIIHSNTIERQYLRSFAGQL